MSLINQGFPQPLVAPVALAVAQASARPITGALGTGAAPDIYAANSLSPDYVADFSATDADYFRVAGNDSDFETAFTSDSEGGGLATQVDSSGNLVWRAHNQARGSQSIGDATWTASNVTTTQNAEVAPDGTTTASNIVPTGSGVSHYELQVGPDVEINLGKVARVFVKANGYGYFQLTTGNAGDGYVNINLSSGAVTDSGRMSGLCSATAYGNGWYLLEATGFINDDVFLCPRPDDGTRLATFDADGSSGVLAWGYHLTREDLGGMADNPDPVATGLEKYVPTTTAARYLARRRHHRWDGSAYVPTCLHEPVGATNVLTYSRDFSQWSVSNGATEVQNATGIDGVANSAWTVTDANAVAPSLLFLDSTCPDDSNPAVVSFHVEKVSSPSFYPAVGAQFIGGTTVTGRYVVDPSDGSVTAANAATAVYVEDVGDFWRVSVVVTNNGTGNTTTRALVYPAYNSDGTASADGSTQGSTVFDQVDVVLNQSLPSSPIITNGSTVTRTADTLKGKAASLPYSSTAISMAVQGRYDAGGQPFENLLAWYAASTARITLQRVSASLVAFVENASGGGSELAVIGSYPSGPSSSIRAAGRWVASTEVQGALNGTAGVAESATMPAMPALSSATLRVNGTGLSAGETLNGTVDTIRLWDEDIAEAGIESGSAGVEIQGVPTISGTEAVGSTLTASAATVVGGPSPSTTWQWQRSANGTSGWADISGATSSTYTLVSADEDQYVRAVQTSSVTAGGDTYTDSANSAASGQIANLPLDAVTSAVLAFSVARKLRTAYSGSAIRVRRSSDDAEQDIGFTAAGALDESALTTFCGAGDGFVVTLYEQSGAANAVNMTQSTAANQPQIVSSGVVVKKDGAVAMQSAAGDLMAAAASWSVRPATAYDVKVVAISGANTAPVGSSSGLTYGPLSQNGNASAISANAGTPSVYRNGVLAISSSGTRDDVHTAMSTNELLVWRDHEISYTNADFAGYQTGYTTAFTITAPPFESERIVVTSASDAAAIEVSQLAFYGIAA